MRLRHYVVVWISTVGLISVVLAALPAGAHFILVKPDAWMSQNGLGDPQKVGPCGNDGFGTPTDKVTTFRPGETIEITVNEVIYHPGHYRVALAVNDQSELPAPPPITPVGSDPCGSTVIDESPEFPILADNLLPHSSPLGGARTFTVTLPNDVTCDRCTLQVLEYMSQHAQPCFYYHCAEIAIQNGPAPTPTSIPSECAGDCNYNNDVAVNELITMVSIALGQSPMSRCPAGNANGDGEISIGEIITAVNRALNGC